MAVCACVFIPNTIHLPPQHTPVHGLSCLLEFSELSRHDAIPLCIVCRYSLVHVGWKEVDKHVHKVGGRRWELHRLGESHLGNGLQSVKLWYKVIVDEIVVLLHCIMVSLHLDS